MCKVGEVYHDAFPVVVVTTSNANMNEHSRVCKICCKPLRGLQIYTDFAFAHVFVVQNYLVKIAANVINTILLLNFRYWPDGYLIYYTILAGEPVLRTGELCF